MTRLRVKAGRGLVEEHQFRPADHGGGERDPLLLPAGQPLDRGARRAGQAQPVQQPGRVQRADVEPGEHAQVLAGPDGRRDAAGLQHHPDPRPQRPGVGDRVEPEDRDRARVGPPVPLADLDRGGLARPVRAEHRGHRAAGGPQAEPVHRGLVPVPLDEIADLDRGGIPHARECRGCGRAPGAAPARPAVRRVRHGQYWPGGRPPNPRWPSPRSSVTGTWPCWPGGRPPNPRVAKSPFLRHGDLADAAATRASIRRGSVPTSGCHCTASRNGPAAAGSTASMTPSAAHAVATRPSPSRSMAW